MHPPFVPRLRLVWLRLRYSYWFLPAVMMAAAALLALVLLISDRTWARGLAGDGFTYGGGPAGAREMLAVIAASMITVAGVVFSIMVVALQLASSQFGPRILRNFMRDRGNQLVLGTFVATFVYSLLVLRTIQGNAASDVPALSVSIAVLLVLVSIGVLIYYIHHAATSIQAPHIIQAIGHELFATIDRIYPETPDADERAPSSVAAHPREADFSGVGAELRLDHTGYIQAIDEALVLRIARDHDLQIRLMLQSGAFVAPETVVMRLFPARHVDDSVMESLREAVSTGSVRTQEQDVKFAVEQLVEVAVRSLSPGINDPFTAMSCVDWLGAALVRIVRRPAPPSVRIDERGVVRCIAPPVSLEELLEVSFGRIRTYAHGHPSVMRTLAEQLAQVFEFGRDPGQRQAIRRQAELVFASAERTLPEEENLQRLREITDRVRELPLEES